MLISTVRPAVVSALVIMLVMGGCSSAPLSVQISPDGKSFSWRLNGQDVDPVNQGVMWEMTYDYKAEEHISGRRKRPGPTSGRGKAEIKDSKNSYDALVEFTLDDDGYKHVKLTLSGGTLPNEMTAEATRP